MQSLTWKVWFCSGSSTSRSAAAGSPWKLLCETLSISSLQESLSVTRKDTPNDTAIHTHKRITGSGLPAFLRACTMFPGPLATYVRLWPLISASSRTPPSDIRWNGLSSACAMDCPSDVFPVPGGPTNLATQSAILYHVIAFGLEKLTAGLGLSRSVSAACVVAGHQQELPPGFLDYTGLVPCYRSCPANWKTAA